MAFADAVKYNEVRRMRGLPIGTIIPWAAESASIPKGWLVCNGRAIDIEEYPLLYDCIGNTYGGTAGSTFKTPTLTNAPKGIVDIFEGYFQFLYTGQGGNGAWDYSQGGAPSTIGVPSRPEYSKKSDDPFWSLVGGGDNGNESSNGQSTWSSKFDLVGEFSGSPNFLASYDEITLTKGSYFGIAIYEDTQLYDYHLTMHSHGIANESTTEAQAWSAGNGQAAHCPGSWPRGRCKMVCSKVTALRTRTGLTYANNSSHLQECFGKYRSPAAGGGSVQPVPGGETASGGYFPGDGRCVNNMTCASFSSNDKILFTSLSNEDTVGANPHQHSSNQYNFEAQFSIINPGIVNNIKINTVKINNSSGQNFGNIQATTATPTLDMLFIIRAY